MERTASTLSAFLGKAKMFRMAFVVNGGDGATANSVSSITTNKIR